MNPDILSFSLKNSQQKYPLQFPHRGSYGERYLLTGHFYICLNISLFITPTDSMVMEPPSRSLTWSQWTAILHHLSHWSIYSIIHSFIHVSLQESPKISLLHMGKNMRSPSTEPHAEGRSTYNRVRPGSPRGSLMIMLSLPQCQAALGTIHSTLAWVDQSTIGQPVS